MALDRHSELCASIPNSQRCKDCRDKYNREKCNRSRHKKKKTEKVTRSVTLNKLSIYNDFFCEDCKGKTTSIPTTLCPECKKNYNRAKSTKSYTKCTNKPKNQQTEPPEQPTKISSVHINQLNQTKPNDLALTENGVNVIGLYKTYSHLFCIDCKDLTYKNLCTECKTVYNRAKSNKCYHENQSEINNLNSNNMAQSDQPNQNDLQKKKRKRNISKKTRQNLQSIFKNNHRSPTKRKIIATDSILKSPEPMKRDALEILQCAQRSEIEAEVCGTIIKGLKDEYGEKSDIVYNMLTSLAPYFRGKTATFIQKCLHVTFDNAKKIQAGEKLGRKV